MEKVLLQNIDGINYLWKLNSKEVPIQRTQKDLLLDLSNHLLGKFFSIQSGDTEQLDIECKFFLKELIRMFPNLIISRDEFTGYNQEQFNSFHSELLIYKSNAAVKVIESVEKMFAFESNIPKFFVKDINLKTQKEKFVTFAVLNKELSFKSLVSKYIKLFKELIMGFNPATEDYIKEICLENFAQYVESSDMLKDSVKTRVRSYLIDLVSSFRAQEITIEILQVDEGINTNDSVWAIVFCELYLNEPVELKQVIKITDSLILITVAFEHSNKLIILSFSKFLVTKNIRLLKEKDTFIAVGSVPEKMILIQNSKRACWIANLTEKKVILKKQIEVYSDRINNITSACYIKEFKHILYIYSPGGLGQYNLNRSSLMDFSLVPNYRLEKMFLSESGNCIALVTEIEIIFFNNSLSKIIGQESQKSTFLSIDQDIAQFITIDQSCIIEITLKKIELNWTEENKNNEVSIDRIGHVAQQTYNTSIELISDFFKPKRNSFQEVTTARKNSDRISQNDSNPIVARKGSDIGSQDIISPILPKKDREN